MVKFPPLGPLNKKIMLISMKQVFIHSAPRIGQELEFNSQKFFIRWSIFESTYKTSGLFL